MKGGDIDDGGKKKVALRKARDQETGKDGFSVGTHQLRQWEGRQCCLQAVLFVPRVPVMRGADPVGSAPLFV